MKLAWERMGVRSSDLIIRKPKKDKEPDKVLLQETQEDNNG